MRRIWTLLLILVSLPVVAQVDEECSQQALDLNGDMQVTVADLVLLLSGFGADLDSDDDSILDCVDECVGQYDACGVCNGQGPQIVIIDEVTVIYDSLFNPGLNTWDVYEVGADTSYSLVCDSVELFNACGDPLNWDGYEYPTVQIGGQCWFAENLRSTSYAEGSSIPTVYDVWQWEYADYGAQCYYNNSYSNLAVFGRLYNALAIQDARGLCPYGWHVPAEEEWLWLEAHVGTQGWDGEEGIALKSDALWNGADAFGFDARPGGIRVSQDNCNGFCGFSFLGSFGGWWARPDDDGVMRLMSMNSVDPDLSVYTGNGPSGYSVRCLWDVVHGCTDSGYLEFNPLATDDDGSCATAVYQGCTDPGYEEFEEAANVDDGSCLTLLPFDCGLPYAFGGHDYATVDIGGQCWFAENLKTTVYADSTEIPVGLTDEEWIATQEGAAAVFGEGDSYCYSSGATSDVCDEVQSLEEYGRLYNWYAVISPHGLCPYGWHVPTDGDWSSLLDHLIAEGIDSNMGAALKSTTGWSGGGNGTDDLGYSALPGGWRDYLTGNFYSAGDWGYWWSSSELDGWGWYMGLSAGSSGISFGDWDPRDGYSIRCIRNDE